MDSKTTDFVAMYKQGDQMIEDGRKNKFLAIKGLMLEGYTYTSMGNFFGVSEQSIAAYYKYYSKDNL
jgi:hypothetical protein